MFHNKTTYLSKGRAKAGGQFVSKFILTVETYSQSNSSKHLFSTISFKVLHNMIFLENFQQIKDFVISPIWISISFWICKSNGMFVDHHWHNICFTVIHLLQSKFLKIYFNYISVSTVSFRVLTPNNHLFWSAQIKRGQHKVAPTKFRH